MMVLSEVNKQVSELKARGKVLTNLFPGCVGDDVELDVKENESALTCRCRERFRFRCFYAGNNEESIASLLDKMPKDTVAEVIYRKENEDSDRIMIEKAGFELAETSIRRTYTYSVNPHSIPQSGRRERLQKLYDPTMGEMANMDDAEELFQMNKETFDPLIDEVLTLDEWKDIIRNNECILFKAKGRIITYYVFKKETNKLYSHISVNRGPGNFLYNLEQRIFDECWEEGIRTNYCWVNASNTAAITRMDGDYMKAVKGASYLYNDIFIKR